MDVVARELGVGAQTIERWLSDALSEPSRQKVWTGAARFDAVLSTESMGETARNAWCRANGVFPQELAKWRQHAREALA